MAASDNHPNYIMVWLGLAVLSIALLVLMRTRWGQSRPLRKCLVLSVLAHYATNRSR